MYQLLSRLSEEKIQFICSECGITKDELFSMDHSALYSKVYRTLSDIMVEEGYFDELSYDGNKRGETATKIFEFLSSELE